MNLINKVKYNWHYLNQIYYQALINDCLSTSIRNKLLIKATYHSELAKHYTATITSTQSAS